MSAYGEARELSGTRELRELGRDATFALRPPPGGLVVRCHRGTLLVTQAGDPRDHVLLQGDEVRLRGCGLVAAWALSDVAVTVEGARRP